MQPCPAASLTPTTLQHDFKRLGAIGVQGFPGLRGSMASLMTVHDMRRRPAHLDLCANLL
jgi:hypothetical protein